MKLQRPEIRILTAEDPVEYVYDEVSQSEVDDQIGNTFASYLRSFLRHDPEVIMVGEIRDEATAEMAFRAAQTGHLLLSTLHTENALAALPRLLDLEVESSLIGSSLIGVMSQRLVRRVCDACRQPCTPPKELVAEFFTAVPSDLTFTHGAGCAACGHSGYKGRTLIVDLWVPDEHDLRLITKRAPFDEIAASATRTIFTMAQNANEHCARAARPSRSCCASCRTPPWPSIGGGFPLRKSDLASDPRNQGQQALDVRERRAEVHDARAQREFPADDRVRQEGFAALLETRQDLAVDLVEAWLNVGRPDTGLERRRDVPERRDAQFLRESFELRVRAHQRVEVTRQADVVRNHADRPGASDLPQPEPDLERAEAARVLRAALDEVDHIVAVEVVVGRVIGERPREIVGAAHQRAAGLERRVEPLVRIDRHGVGQRERAQALRRVRRLGREPPVRAVDVKPETPGAADGRQFGQRIDRARAH